MQLPFLYQGHYGSIGRLPIAIRLVDLFLVSFIPSCLVNKLSCKQDWHPEAVPVSYSLSLADYASNSFLQGNVWVVFGLVVTGKSTRSRVGIRTDVHSQPPPILSYIVRQHQLRLIWHVARYTESDSVHRVALVRDNLECWRLRKPSWSLWLQQVDKYCW